MKVILIVMIFAVNNFSHVGMSIDTIEVNTLEECKIVAYNIHQMKKRNKRTSWKMGVLTQCVEIPKT